MEHNIWATGALLSLTALLQHTLVHTHLAGCLSCRVAITDRRDEMVVTHGISVTTGSGRAYWYVCRVLQRLLSVTWLLEDAAGNFLPIAQFVMTWITTAECFGLQPMLLCC